MPPFHIHPISQTFQDGFERQDLAWFSQVHQDLGSLTIQNIDISTISSKLLSKGARTS